ncbi:MAG: RDD family protein [Proteobacteria bacterium]|nr:RDD family protein [Pseudomonadota bacterium]
MIDPKYSTFRPRLIAVFVDCLISIPFLALCSLLQSIFNSVTAQLAFYLITSSAWLVYSIAMHARYGQTLGKRYARIIVLDVSEQPLSLRQALWRDCFGLVTWAVSLVVDIPQLLKGVDLNARESMTTIELALASGSFIWVAMEFVTMFTNDKRRAVHDFIAGSVVVRLPARELREQSASALS